MRITEITVGLIDSIKVDNYQYKKPEIRVTAQLDEGEDYKEAQDKLTAYVKAQMERYKKSIK